MKLPHDFLLSSVWLVPMRFCMTFLVFIATFLVFGMAQQRPCSHGRFRTVETDPCVACAPNYVFDEDVRATGVVDACVCRSGFEAANVPDECVMCPPGKISLQNTPCTPCAVGTFASFSGQTSCTTCQTPDLCTSPGCIHCKKNDVISSEACPVPQRKMQPGDDFSLFKT